MWSKLFQNRSTTAILTSKYFNTSPSRSLLHSLSSVQSIHKHPPLSSLPSVSIRCKHDNIKNGNTRNSKPRVRRNVKNTSSSSSSTASRPVQPSPSSTGTKPRFEIDPNKLPPHVKKSFPSPADKVNPYWTNTSRKISSEEKERQAHEEYEAEFENSDDDLINQHEEEEDLGVMSDYSSSDEDPYYHDPLHVQHEKETGQTRQRKLLSYFYDTIMRDQPYEDKAALVYFLINKHTTVCKKVIELECRTGSFAVEFVQLG